MMMLDRLQEIRKGFSDPVVLELVAEIENLRKVLSETQGSLHVINHHARFIRRWISDPNLHPEESCKFIEDKRLEAHERISAVLFPFEREKWVAERLMQ